MSRPRILVIDDSSTIRLQVRRVLEKAGYEVRLATEGSEGILLAREWCPQLIILDIRMPGLDGYDVCHELKRAGSPSGEVPIVFLTGLASNALSLLGQEMGAYLQKPVRPDELLQTVDRLAGRAATPAGARLAPRRQ